MTIFQQDQEDLRFRGGIGMGTTGHSVGPAEDIEHYEIGERQIPFQNRQRHESSPSHSSRKSNSKLKNMSFGQYMKAELTRGYVLDSEEERYAARREKVYTFMMIPIEVEKLMGFGFFQCADAFLFLFTFLPLRCLYALYNLIVRFFNKLTGVYKGPMSIPTADRCDFLKIFIFLICVLGFAYIDTSVLYHVVKSQSVIKLYIFFNMLEVGDRLFASFVQDTLDALFLTATEKKEKRSKMGVLGHFALTLISVFLHALVILLQGTTLSVAINSSNRSLLTVMMSNNFVELKGSVFKKFDKINLFQVSCSDIRERFHLAVLLVIVCLQTMREYSWVESQFWVLFPDVIMVLTAEIIVDWLKHAFITRFNEIPPGVYKEYTLSLAYDLAQTKQKRLMTDPSDMVGRRLGFVPLPLAIVLARIFRPILQELTPPTLILLLLGYLALASFRFLNSIILLGKACDLIDKHIDKLSPKHQYNNNNHHQAHIQDDQVSKGSLESGKSFEIIPKRKSNPATRTPSPSRGNSFLEDELNENFKENEIGHFGGEYRKLDLNNKAKFFRSKSASHTPRPSLVGIGDINTWKLGEAPDLPESAALLMANSSVSILSVSLNEEMLRASSKDNSADGTGGHGKKNIAPPKPARKYSLGNNDQDIIQRENANSSSMSVKNSPTADAEGGGDESTLNLTVKETDKDKTSTSTSSHESLNNSDDKKAERSTLDDLDITLYNDDEHNASLDSCKVAAGDKENVNATPRTLSESSTTQDENNGAQEVPTNTIKRKKKSLLPAWLSSSSHSSS